MEITMTPQTPFACPSVPVASRVAMPMGGRSLGILAERRTTWIPATGLSFATPTDGTDLRGRNDQAVKGHVALVAYVPGDPAWSPPNC